MLAARCYITAAPGGRYAELLSRRSLELLCRGEAAALAAVLPLLRLPIEWGKNKSDFSEISEGLDVEVLPEMARSLSTDTAKIQTGIRAEFDTSNFSNAKEGVIVTVKFCIFR